MLGMVSASHFRWARLMLAATGLCQALVAARYLPCPLGSFGGRFLPRLCLFDFDMVSRPPKTNSIESKFPIIGISAVRSKNE
jgi:hypothetical protein